VRVGAKDSENAEVCAHVLQALQHPPMLCTKGKPPRRPHFHRSP
jgi:hypothetical protein